MKKICVLILSFTLFVSIVFAQTNKLENYEVTSFNGVTRISLAFSRRPITNVIKEANSLKLSISIPQCELGNIPTRFSTPDMYANIMIISRPSNDLTIEITTTQSFEHVRQTDTQGRQYFVHLDVLKTISPHRIEDIISLLDYYNFVGNRSAINELIQSANEMFPNHPLLASRMQNRFNNPVVYAPQTNVPQVAQRTLPQARPVQSDIAPSPNTTPTQNTPPAQNRLDSPQAQQQMDLPTTITDTPPQMTNIPLQSPTILPQRVEYSLIGTDNVSFTLITRNDRFPTRIPQTKPIFLPNEPEIEPEIEPYHIEATVQDEVLPEPEPVPVAIEQPVEEILPLLHAEPEIIRESVSEPLVVYRSITDTTSFTETEKLVLSYYRIASVDSILVAFLVGASANIVGDFENAIHFLSQVPPFDVNYENALSLLHDSYAAMGDTTNADFYTTLLNINESGSENTNFINTPIALWITGVLGILTLIAGFIIAFVFLKAKKKKRDTSFEEDYSAHITNIQKAYDNKQINTPSKSFDEMENTRSLSSHYENPPIVTEELTPEEKNELKSEEKKPMQTFTKTMNNPYKETKYSEPDDDIDEYESFSDDEYRKNLVLKLYKDGWKLEEIAKELQISHREIDFILKING